MHVLEREKRQANVSVASGFVLITAIIFYPFVIYLVPPPHTHTLTLGYHISRLQAKISWVTY